MHRALQVMARHWQQALASLESLFGDKGQRPGELVEELKATMWLNAGIVRDRQSLNRALETIMERKDAPAMLKSTRDLIRFLEFRNMRLIGEMVCRSAIERTESRASHFRSDYPLENNDDWGVTIQVTKELRVALTSFELNTSCRTTSE